MQKYTPMIQQYLKIKKNYKNCLLFFRLGDFYELFFEDANIAAENLDITLTSKEAGKDENGEKIKIDMCGVPFHSADGYISKLISHGFNVAICEQLEDPKNVKGIVKRDVVRVITPGTVLDTSVLDETKNNYIMCIFENKANIGLSFSDVSTGEFLTTQFEADEKKKVIDEIAKFNPSEIIANSKTTLKEEIEKIFNVKLNIYQDFNFDFHNSITTLCNHFNVLNLDGFGLEDKYFASICSSGALFSYLFETQKNTLSHINNIKRYSSDKFMILDISSRRNLELTETIRERTKRGSLLWVLDKTKTPMGSRLIRRWIEQPLIDQKEINLRLDSVEEIKNNVFLREDLREILKNVKDIERILSKVIYLTANARDLITLKKSFETLPKIKNILNDFDSGILKSLKKIDQLDDIYNLINETIDEEPPFSIREGGIIKTGYNDKIDEFRLAKKNGSIHLINFENEEREKTGIKNLKVRYNKVFGYYIEVTNSYLKQVPQTYIRKQTLSNCERFITEELKQYEELILEADEKVVDIEYKVFCDIREKIAQNAKRIQKVSKEIAIIDVLCSFAQVAEEQRYCKPKVEKDRKGQTQIISGRHPVVEMLSDSFIPNDTNLDKGKSRLAIITGPNMAGKSTYMRQVALIFLMAQIGSFVPAKSANISITDRIFTRVGASDDLATGQSTFMIEMNEVANILNNATSESILILDEIGRGTSTFDGLSIAWAVLEHIADKKKIGARTLFATHYHELTSIEQKVDGVNNYCVEVKDNGDDIVFLRKIIKGGSESSYGIHVAKLAGIPRSVINRANEILAFLTKNDLSKLNKSKKNDDNFYYTSKAKKEVFFVDELETEFKNININDITPVEALQKLISIKNKLDNL